MELNKFISDFAAEFEMTEPEEITAATSYRELDEWDSLLALSIIGMVNNKYKVKISGTDIREAGTVAKLYELIASRQV